MNILHTETLKGWGGEQNKVINEMVLLRELGHNVYLICNPNSKIAKKAKDLGFEVTELSMNKKNFFKTVPFFLKFIKEKNIDIVFTHGHTDTVIGALASKFSSKKPKFIRERHNLFPVNSFLSRQLHKRLADKVCVLSEAIRDYFLSIGVREEKLFILPSVIDIEKFDKTKSTFRDEFNIPSDATVVGMFTSLYRKKGVYDFIEVVKNIIHKYENVYFIFGGEYRRSVGEVIQETFKNEKRVILTGYREDAANVMRGFDIFVFPSYSEGLGTVLLEAMASKLPSVVYNQKPMSDLIKDGERGLCAAYKDVKDLQTKIEKLINEPDFAEKLGKNAYKYVSDNYTMPVLKNRLKELLEQL
ncbi:glycosyltransferase family 4 protein [Caminibacter sp.]